MLNHHIQFKINHYDKFEEKTKDMDIPKNRRQANSQNALWFLREGAILNRNHPNVSSAIFHAQRIG